MNEADVSLACARLLVDELARVRASCVCIAPGSRSTPLALAFARDGRIPLSVHLDERAAAFYALGSARATGRPGIVVTTSGTAAANVFPAVVEAAMAGVPLLVLTADRPPELRDVGANQTIDQTRLYGGYVRWFFDPGVPEARPGTARLWRSMTARAVHAATGSPPGPVHLNLPFREPLAPTGAAVDLGPDADGRPHDAPWEVQHTGTRLPDDDVLDFLCAAIAATERGVIVAGGLHDGGDAVAHLAERAGWPLVAEPTSGARLPGRALAAPAALLTEPAFADAHRADLVLRFGSTPTSRATNDLVASAGRVWVVDAHGRPADPARTATRTIRSDPRALAAALADRLPEGSSAWLDEWRAADAAARVALDEVLDASDVPFEPRVTRDVAAAVPGGATIVVASSMPVRDLDASMAPRHGVRVLANRGASGIDGFVSTALGVASAGAPTYALAGDLSMLHDAAGLLWRARRAPGATFVVLDNNGGGIFDLLSQSSLPELDELFVTPHDLDLVDVAAAAGCAYVRVERANEVAPALERERAGSLVVHVPIDRKRAVEMRRAVRDAVARALASQP